MMDAMHAARVGGVAREGIARAHSLRAGVPLVICAVPHAAEHGLISWDRHLALTRELFRALAASKADVLLSLHPRSSAETYRGIASDYGLRILTERLSKVLPAADVFVASYSSTVRWALLMGIPTIMADFLGFRYRQFAGLAGSVVVEDATALEQALTRLVGDRGGIERMSRLAMAGEPGTPFDGKACERIMREMARLLQLND